MEDLFFGVFGGVLSLGARDPNPESNLGISPVRLGHITRLRGARRAPGGGNRELSRFSPGTFLAADGGMPPESVLLAVDDGLIRWALEKDLSARGVEVCGVETDTASLARVRWSDYGLVFLDLDPAGKDGLRLLESIHKSSPGAKVVILGCDVDPAVKRAAFERGVWQVVEKPFDLRDVVGLVRSIFGSYSPRRDHRRYLCRLPLRVSVLAGEHDSRVELETLSCNTVNVGPGGMRLLTDYPLKVGQRLTACVMRPSDPCAAHVPRDAVGEVVWLGTTGNGFTGGLRWVSASTPDRIS